MSIEADYEAHATSLASRVIPDAREIARSVARLRARAEVPSTPTKTAEALARCVQLWRDRDYLRRRNAVARIVRDAGYSIALLDASLDALLKPFDRDALNSEPALLASRSQRPGPATLGFIMAGNVVGAGMHELALALIAGCSVLIKTASSEPIFFNEIAHTLHEIDREVGSRVEVFNWDRSRADLTGALIENCAAIVAYGDDQSLAALDSQPGSRGKIVGFGSRVSGAVVAPSALSTHHVEQAVSALARDVALFEQLGCLSVHHIFLITDDPKTMRNFATGIAAALERLAIEMPAAKLALIDAAAIAGVRENARWRAIAGDPIELWESHGPGWTVVLDPAAQFTISPGFRTVFVSAVRNFDELRARLEVASGRIEAFAMAGDAPERAVFLPIANALGISIICAPGEIQSPPVTWRHGNGAFLDFIAGRR
jgi:hypothetical protein